MLNINSFQGGNGDLTKILALLGDQNATMDRARIQAKQDTAGLLQAAMRQFNASIAPQIAQASEAGGASSSALSGILTQNAAAGAAGQVAQLQGNQILGQEQLALSGRNQNLQALISALQAQTSTSNASMARQTALDTTTANNRTRLQLADKQNQNAAADRVFQGKQSELDRLFKGKQNELDRLFKDKEFQASLKFKSGESQKDRDLKLQLQQLVQRSQDFKTQSDANTNSVALRLSRDKFNSDQVAQFMQLLQSSGAFQDYFTQKEGINFAQTLGTPGSRGRRPNVYGPQDILKLLFGGLQGSGGGSNDAMAKIMQLLGR